MCDNFVTLCQVLLEEELELLAGRPQFKPLMPILEQQQFPRYAYYTRLNQRLGVGNPIKKENLQIAPRILCNGGHASQ